VGDFVIGALRRLVGDTITKIVVFALLIGPLTYLAYLIGKPVAEAWIQNDRSRSAMKDFSRWIKVERPYAFIATGTCQPDCCLRYLKTRVYGRMEIQRRTWSTPSGDKKSTDFPNGFYLQSDDDIENLGYRPPDRLYVKKGYDLDELREVSRRPGTHRFLADGYFYDEEGNASQVPFSCEVTFSPDTRAAPTLLE
jgi:hypothetical protein